MKLFTFAIAITCLLFCSPSTLFAQDQLIIKDDVRLPRNKSIQENLVSSLNGFIADRKNLNESKYVDQLHHKAHTFYFEEYENIRQSDDETDNEFYDIHLINAYPTDANVYILELAFLGKATDSTSAIRGIYHLEARKKANFFQFYCPLEFNVRNWSRQKIGNVSYVYQGDFNKQKALDFNEFNTDLAKRLKIAPFQFTYYKCLNQQEGLKLMGFNYDLYSNGRNGGGIHSIENNVWFVFNNSEEYEHDLVHVYFDMFEDSIAYRAVEEGIASYLAGSWGDSFEKMVGLLISKLEAEPKTDLLELFKSKKRLGSHYVDYIINGLICQKIEKEQGFSKVTDLLYVGKKGEEFYSQLEKIIGITEKNFHKEIMKLVEEYKLLTVNK